MAEGLHYYDVDGNEIGLLDWAELFESRSKDPDTSWWQKKTEISDEVHVSSVWIGTDQSPFDDEPPMIFETMVFGGPRDSQCWRYPTKQAAWEDHDRIVKEVLLELVLEDVGLVPVDDDEGVAPKKEPLKNAPDPEAWFHTW